MLNIWVTFEPEKSFIYISCGQNFHIHDLNRKIVLFLTVHNMLRRQSSDFIWKSAIVHVMIFIIALIWYNWRFNKRWPRAKNKSRCQQHSKTASSCIKSLWPVQLFTHYALREKQLSKIHDLITRELWYLQMTKCFLPRQTPGHLKHTRTQANYNIW